ncbi:arginine vasopressin-induced protein 1 [Gouania willdenowi]|uniref:arginine vasopressin-induced protein 1 n=1 Tax=Gouania willdenowi TaxID=441366 RepID=UPI001054C767|nr:arginine vasopressin-induced protein 1 [Gouania willdenowi]
MDTGPASPPSSVLAGPSSLWRLTDRRSRKTGSGNIFSDVNLWQLQKLFRAAGDQDAEQRAQLVWGHGDEAELAQALVGLRTRSQRRGLRSAGRDTLGAHWLRAFNHLRIDEISTGSQRMDPEEESDSEAGAHGSPDSHRHTLVGATKNAPGSLTEDQELTETNGKPVRTTSGQRRGGESNSERYLHRILH